MATVLRPAAFPLNGAPSADVVLDVRDLTVTYPQGAALEAITFSVKAGERVAIIGPNGAGKSTLVKVILGLLQPQSGTITLGDDPRQVGYVPQHESVDWTFPVTVRDVVMMGRVRRIGWLRWPGRADWAVVDAALERVAMADLGRRQIGELSGGQRRRAFIARALAQEARLLLLDEPFSGVDASAQAGLMDTLDDLNRDGLTIILTTHDLSLAFSRFNRVMALNQRVIAFGQPQAVFQPAVLARLYGGRVATWDDAGQRLMFVDEHGCEGC